MSKKYQVYGIGNAIVDIQLQVTDESFAKLQIERGTMRLVDHEQQVELLESSGSSGLKQSSGGSAANTMITFAQLGGKGAFGCCVGDDARGEYYLSEMNDLGTFCAGAVVAGKPTGTCVVLITSDAERTMNTHLGASICFSEHNVSEDLIADSEWLFVEGYLLSTELGRQAVVSAVREAKRVGTKVALSFSAKFVIDIARDTLQELVGMADLLIANSDEVKAYCQTQDEQEAFEAYSILAPRVLMTLRERGVRYSYDGSTGHVPSYDVSAVDETGAGDSFAGGFLYGITHGYSPEDSSRLACFLGSRVVKKYGARLEGDVCAMVNALGLAVTVGYR